MSHANRKRPGQPVDVDFIAEAREAFVKASRKLDMAVAKYPRFAVELTADADDARRFARHLDERAQAVRR